MNKIIVVDLDECLCSRNTFRYWLVFSFFILLFLFRWISLLKFCKSIVLRLLCKIDRVHMKRDILCVTEQLPLNLIQHFCQFLYFFTNPDVLEEIGKYENEHVSAVLCTAAPACYVNVLAKKYQFSHVFATPSVFVSDWKENIGREKLESLMTYYGDDVILDCVITDHHDDLPLLLKSKKCILVKPSKMTLDIVRGQIDFDVI